MIRQYEIYVVNLDPTIGSEMKKSRPCVVLSPDESNKHLNTVVVAPLASKIHGYKFRIKVKASKCHGEIALDHIRSIDKSRLAKKIDSLSQTDIIQLKDTFREYFID